MFNDRYGLTEAVLAGRKTMMRQEEFRYEEELFFAGADDVYTDTGVRLKVRYKVGEVVTIAQSYQDIEMEHPDSDYFLEQIAKAHHVDVDAVVKLPGWRNKMFAKVDFMPHRIRITDVHVERLQDISDEDCLKEGLFFQEYTKNHKKRRHYGFDGFFDLKEWFARKWYDSPREAFAALIDRVSGRGTWERNPWVVVYEFCVVKDLELFDDHSAMPSDRNSSGESSTQ